MTAVLEYRPAHEIAEESAAQGNSAGGGGDIFRILLRRKWLVFLGLAAGLVAGFLLYTQKRPIYESSAQIYVTNRGSSGGDRGLAENQRSFLTEFMTGQEALMKSSEIQRRGAEHLKNVTMVERPGSDLQDYSNFIRSGLKVSRYRDSSSGSLSNVLNISFRSTNPDDPKTVVEQIFKGYRESLAYSINNITETTYKELGRSKGVFAEDKVKVDGKLTQVQLEMSNTTPFTVEYLAQRIAQTQGAKSLEAKKFSDYSYTRKQIENSPPGTDDRNNLLYQLQKNDPYMADKKYELARAQSLEESLYALRINMEEKTESMGPNHPEVRALRKRMDTLGKILHERNELGGNTNFSRDPLKYYEVFVNGELDKAKTNIMEYEKTLEADNDLYRRVSRMAVEENNLKREQIELGAQIRAVESRLSQIEITKDSPTTEARLITPPEEGVKVAPSLMQYVVIAGLMGFAAGGGLAYLAEMTDRSFKSPEEIRRRLGVQIIGHIPTLRPVGDGDSKFGRIDGKLITAIKPKSVESEAYRGVRTSLYFSTRGRGHQVIQVTSPNAGDGKSTLAANLAVSIAQSGRKVILIDCDFRKPRVHKIFGLDGNGKSEFGLADVIGGDSELFSVIQESAEVKGLYLLPCGHRPENPAELLTSPKFQEVLQRIRDEYDLVIIDTPPLLAVSDPSVVAPRVDGVILTMTISKNGRPAAERAREMLASVGANVLGVVVNNSAGDGGGYGYGYRNTYGYGYGNYGYASQPYEDTAGPEELGDSDTGRRLRHKD